MHLGLIILGPPGAGKGSIAARVSAQYGIPHISSGAILRQIAEKETVLGETIKKMISAGNFVDDLIITEIIERRLDERDCEKGFILDGFPRNKKQAGLLEQILEKTGRKITKVVFVRVPKSILVERVSGRRECPKCGRIYHVKTIPPIVPGKCDAGCGNLVQRSDDRKDVIEKRVDIYNKQTKSLKGYYKKKKLLAEIDASGNIIENMENVRKALSGKG